MPTDRRTARMTVATALSTAAVLVPAAGVVACARLAWHLGVSGRPAWDPAAALLLLAAAALGAVLLWATAAAATGVVRGWRYAGTGATAVVRSRSRRGDLVAAAVAAVVAAALTAPSASAGVAPAGSHPALSVSSPDLPGAPVDGDTAEGRRADRGPAQPATSPPGSWTALADQGFRAPRGAAPDSAALVTGRSSRDAGRTGEVVVLAGDSLWSIAADHLGPDACDAEVAAAWPVWWQANRQTVGDDPDLLLPGQRLQVPDLRPAG